MEVEHHPFAKGDASSKPSFLGSMLVCRGVFKNVRVAFEIMLIIHFAAFFAVLALEKKTINKYNRHGDVSKVRTLQSVFLSEMNAFFRTFWSVPNFDQGNPSYPPQSYPPQEIRPY